MGSDYSGKRNIRPLGQHHPASAERDGDLLEQVHLLLHAGLHPGVEDRVAELLARALHEQRERRAAVALGEVDDVQRLVRRGERLRAGISYTSVVTIRSSGTISRYSPWKATSNPPSATIT